MLKRFLFIPIVFLLLITPASAEEPLDVIKDAVNQIIDILKDPQYDDSDKKEEQRQKIWDVVTDIFSFNIIARGTLRRYDWERFSDKQKKEFTELFKELLGNTYLERLQSDYQNEKVVFEDQEKLSETTAMVRTKVVRNDTEIPVDYRLIFRDDRWRIYNVYVENVSLVTNYRDQFSRILMKKSPEELLEQLREKVEKPEDKA